MCIAAALYGEGAKAVFDLTSGDIQKIEKHLIKGLSATAEYYRDHNRSFKAIVVISGNAYKFFISDLKHSPYADMQEVSEKQSYLRTQFRNLQDSYYVKFKMCSKGMKSRKIPEAVVYRFVEMDKIKNVYLIDAQNQGYAYLPIH